MIRSIVHILLAVLVVSLIFHTHNIQQTHASREA